MLGFKGTRVFQVHEMIFFNDFLNVIHKYDGVLDVSLENVKKLENDVQDLEKTNLKIDELLKLCSEEAPKEDEKAIA